MANADGGDIVYGMEELDGCAVALVPITTDDPDAASRRLLQVLDAGLEPRVPGVTLRHVEVEKGYILLVRVHASYDGPHCIRMNANRRFVTRNGTTTADMTYDQIRSAFDRTATLAERARQLIAERREAISARRTPTPILKGPVFALHLVPLAGIAERRIVNLRDVYQTTFTNFIGNDWGGGSRTFNFDGLTVHQGGDHEDGHYSYVHIFRTGALEAARLAGGKRRLDQNGPERSIVWSLDMSKYFYATASQFLRALKGWGYSGPALLGLALLDVQGYELGIGDVFHRFSRGTADRPSLTPPEVWLNSIDREDIDDALRSSLDIIWQAFDQECCPDFDKASGRYSPRRG